MTRPAFLVLYLLVIGALIYWEENFLAARGASWRARALSALLIACGPVALFALSILGLSGPIPAVVSAVPPVAAVASRRWLIAHTGGPGPVLGLYQSYRRIASLSSAEDWSNSDSRRALEAELDRVEQWRSPETDEIISLLQRLYRIWLDAEDVSDQWVIDGWARLFVMMDQLWGTDLATRGLRPTFYDLQH